MSNAVGADAALEGKNEKEGACMAGSNGWGLDMPLAVDEKGSGG